MSDKIEVLIVDDHQILVDGVVEILSKFDQYSIMATASDGKRALDTVKHHAVDVVITDISMPGIKGTDLIPEIKKINPKIKVIALSMHEEKHIIKDVLKAGADAYVLKRSTHNELILALEKIQSGEVFVSDAITKMLVDEIRYPSIEELLSEREREIIKLVVNECTAKQIAETLFISEKTVETHKRNIFRKTGTSTLVGLTKFAIEHQLV